MSETSIPPPLRRTAVVVRGVVQGVGFRPFVYLAAQSRALSGWVLNEADLVRIEVQGPAADVAAFLKNLQENPPARAKIDSLEIRDLPCQDDLPALFEIRISGAASAPRPTIPADLAACADCLAEISDPAQRRHAYPFTNCTNCGPRWSIIEQLPYDRPRTSMKSFAMCDACRAEYENPADRRFHAQPIACPRCGPRLTLLTRQREAPAETPGKENADHHCILRAAAAILAGKILALKGLGGFQLIADAANAEAVALLRERKRRPDRPFALMMRSLPEVRRYCEVSDEEAQMLTSHQAPIVLLRRIDASFPLPPSPFPLAPNIAPGNPCLGVMLPYTPLHHLLLQAVDRPIVCTSGNLSEEPMAISLEEALKRLGRVADLFLTHDRPIVRPVDDSIVRFGPAGVQVLRRARGFAPLPVPVRNPGGRSILALGGHLKNTVALCLGGEEIPKAEGGRGKAEENFIHPSSFILHTSPTILSAHIGDLDTAASVEVFHKAIADLVQFYKIRPDAVVCDLHPDYASTRQAETLAARWNAPLVRVQHHHAHVAACMAEHDLAGPALGFAWDGTGYGADGTIWGGEAIVCPGNANLLIRPENANLPVRSPADKEVDRPPSMSRAIGDPDSANQEVRAPGSIEAFSRVAHLRTFALPGGDAAARQPRRSALGVLYEIFGEDAANYAKDWFPPGELKTLLKMLHRGTNCPRTSSLGRLFDAVAAIVDLEFSGAMPTLAVGIKDTAKEFPHARGEREAGAGEITFEGQAAMSLEFAAETTSSLPMGEKTESTVSPLPLGEGPGVRAYRIPLQPAKNGPLVADWEPMIREILAEHASGEPAARISAQFHRALAEMAVEVAKSVNLPQIVLSGGCFQNALLLRQTHSRLTAAGFQVFLPQQFPPGDGGIALGQVYIAGLKPMIG